MNLKRVIEFIKNNKDISIMIFLFIVICLLSVLLFKKTSNENSVNIQFNSGSPHDTLEVEIPEVQGESSYLKNGEYGSFPFIKKKLTSNPYDFILAEQGHRYDEGFGAQCVAGFKQFTFSNTGQILRAPQGAALGYASATDKIKTMGFDVIYDRNSLKDGDWVVSSLGRFGHIAMFYQGKLFGQNQRAQDLAIGSAFSLDDIWSAHYDYFLVAFRPKLYNQPKSEPIVPEKPKTGRKLRFVVRYY